jgi:DNA modification methylase
MIITGDCLEILPTFEEKSIQCVVTSPPYYGLRDYGCAGQIGLESTPEAYVEKLVAVFREVRRVLRDDGTVWLNLGDSYNSPGPNNHNKSSIIGTTKLDGQPSTKSVPGLKPKDLIGIPWRVAFALQADGWYLRQDIIWAKPNPMPESVTDRCTKSHEYIFLLTKSARYFMDMDSIREPNKRDWRNSGGSMYHPDKFPAGSAQHRGGKEPPQLNPLGANRRSVWTITTKPFKEAHFATFPPEIPEICIRAGSKPGDTVLDPFSGAGTTGVVAEKLGRKYVGVELKFEYNEMAKRRIEKVKIL